MDAKQRVLWECPVCGSRHSSDWRLSAHIGGMAFAYKEHHYEWAVSREPSVAYASSPGTAASMLRPFVLDEIRPHVPEAETHETDSEQMLSQFLISEPLALGSKHLLSNLTEGYTLIAHIETRLHSFVIDRLKDEYGALDDEWWTAGIPRPNRKKCADRQEGDDNRYDRWLYLDLLDLKDVVEARWPRVFASHAMRLDNFRGKAQFLKHFETMNLLRNQIMHPLKGQPLGQDDFEFLHNWSVMVDKFSE